MSICLPVVAASASADGTGGVWRNPQDSVHVEVRHCGASMCGTVIWANERAIADAKRGGTDNLIGLQLFRDFSMETPAHFSVAINSYAAQDLLKPLFSVHGLSTSC